jgi:hypothetical protein
MPYKKIQIRPGVNRENTRYTTEGGWYESDKIRFRQGSPEKIGGWERISTYTFLGVCRSLWNWVTLRGQNIVSVGTEIKYYLERGSNYYDITPIRSTTAAGDVTFAAVNGDATLTVSDTAHGATEGSYVTFSGALSLGGNITATVLNQEYVVATIVDDDNYTIEAKDTSGNEVLANASDTGNGGASVVGAYQINIGAAVDLPLIGWSGGCYGLGTWGFGDSSTISMRLWSQSNFGEDLLFAYRGGGLYYWDATNGVTTRAVNATSLSGASDVPVIVNYTAVSDINRFVFAFGCNDYGGSTLDPMLIRWSDQEDAANWTPAATNQAGSLRLSHGSEVVTALQARQEVLVWTDSALYGLQYLGAPEVWGATLLGDNLSIASQNATAYVSNVAFWMGRDKFYMYDGTVKPLVCNVRKFIFNDFNDEQYAQVIAGTNEEFHEVWWFYPSAGSETIDKYVVYNYVENIWYYGTMARTAWLDSGLRDNPLAATYSNNLVYHEIGTDDKETDTPAAINAYVTSSEFDLDDGHQFMLINRMLPDVTFDGSSSDSPAISMTLSPLKNSGSGYTSPASVGGNSSATVTRTATVPIEEFTGQVYVRVRGRQMVIKIESSGEGVAWQLGSPRFDMRPDGRR